MTPTLSLEAFQESVTDVWPTALVASPFGVDGGCVSDEVLPTAVVMSVWIWAAVTAVL